MMTLAKTNTVCCEPCGVVGCGSCFFTSVGENPTARLHSFRRVGREVMQLIANQYTGNGAEVRFFHSPPLITKKTSIKRFFRNITVAENAIGLYICMCLRYGIILTHPNTSVSRPLLYDTCGVCYAF